MTTRPLVADESQLMACIHCGFCSPTCPTYAVRGDESDSPRGRIYYIRALREGRLDPVPEVVTHLNRCLTCFACETACPSGVRYRDLIEDARAWLGSPAGRAEQARVAAPAAPAPGVPAESGIRATRSWRFFFRRILPSAALLRWSLAPLWVAERLGLRELAGRAGKALLPAWAGNGTAFLPRPIPSPMAGSPPAVYPAKGERVMRVGYLTGCVMEGFVPELNRLQIAVLQELGVEVVVPRGAGCCGALALHEGARDLAKGLAGSLAEVFAGESVDAIVASAAGCGSTMKDYGNLLSGNPAAVTLAGKVRDFSEIAAPLAAARPPRHEVRMKAAYQEACHLAHAQKVTAQPRALLRAIPGLDVVECPEQELCCGSAGVYNLVEPVLAGALGKRKAERAASTGAAVVITANPGCLLQLRAHAAPDAPPVLHLAEVLGRAYGVQLVP